MHRDDRMMIQMHWISILNSIKQGEYTQVEMQSIIPEMFNKQTVLSQIHDRSALTLSSRTIPKQSVVNEKITLVVTIKIVRI